MGSRPHLCVDLGRVRLRGLCHRRLRSQDPGLRVASTMATSMVLDAIEQAIWTRQQEGVLDLKDVLWVADLTYVSTWAGFAYVAFVTDAYARRILGCGRFHDGHLHGPRRDRASHLDPPTRRRTRPERRSAKFDAALQSHLDALIAEYKRDHDNSDGVSDQRPPLPGNVEAFLRLLEAGWDAEVARRPHGQHTTNVFQVEYAFLLAGPDGLLDRVEDHGGGHRGSDRQPRILRA